MRLCPLVHLHLEAAFPCLPTRSKSDGIQISADKPLIDYIGHASFDVKVLLDTAMRRMRVQH